MYKTESQRVLQQQKLKVNCAKPSDEEMQEFDYFSASGVSAEMNGQDSKENDFVN